MLRKFNNSRTVKDNMQLGALTAFSAGMVNVVSVIIFFAFTSNVTGHYAVLAEEVAKGNWNQAFVVLTWIFLFFIGGFVSNFIIINFNDKNTYMAHATPLILEMICLFSVGTYGAFYYTETLWETEIMVGFMLFAMGLQNGLTASISSFSIKTTHLTGLTTDLGVLASLYTKKKYRKNKALIAKRKVLLSIVSAYLLGGIFAGMVYLKIQFFVFYVACLVIGIIIGYEYYKLKINKLIRYKRQRFSKLKKIAA